MTLVMGIWANRPFALAPGMGLNAVVAFQLILGNGLTWQQAMAVIVVEGVLITALVLLGLREAVMNAIPTMLKHAIGAGIGLFILFLGLVSGGLVRVPVESVAIVDGVAVSQPAPPLQLAPLDNLPVLITIIGLAITLFLFARGWQFALLAGIAVTTIIAVLANAATGYEAFAVGAQPPGAIFAMPDLAFLGLPGLRAVPSMFTALGALAAVLAIFSIMLTDFFDTMGTVIGVSDQMGDVGPDGEVENLRPMLTTDSLAAAVGGAVGASSVTTYIESSAGVGVGGRTGLTSVVVAALFFLSMFFAPIAGVIPPQATAPALIIVGFLMARALKEIEWSDLAMGFPALLIVALMPLTYSITNGIGAGFIAYVVIQSFSGKTKDVHPLMWASAAAFAVYFAEPWLRTVFGL